MIPVRFGFLTKNKILGIKGNRRIMNENLIMLGVVIPFICVVLSVNFFKKGEI